MSRDARDLADIAKRRDYVERAKRRLLIAAEKDRAAKQPPKFVRCVESEWVFSAAGADTTPEIRQPTARILERSEA